MSRKPEPPPREGPVLIEIGDAEPVAPAAAPPVPDTEAPRGTAMQTAATLAARRASPLVRWFWRLAVALLVFVVSVAAWDFVTGLIERNLWLGTAALVLTGLFVATLLALAIREWAAYARLAKLDDIHRQADAVRATGDLKAARAVVARLRTLYAGRDELAEGLAALRDREPDILDADAVLALAEARLMAPLDVAARREVEAAARQVAAVTALVPLALADVVAALTANLRMIRRIAEIYGGRAGTFGAWRLTRSVLTHLVATGAVAVGDDMIGSIAGGGMLSRLSRRFGEGVVNGALTARVGLAAIEVCRPLPFRSLRRPSVTNMVRRALTGLFGERDG